MFLNAKASTEGRWLFSVMAKRAAVAAGEGDDCLCRCCPDFDCPNSGTDDGGGREEDDGVKACVRGAVRVDIKFKSDAEENRLCEGRSGGGDESWVRDDVRDSAGVYVLTITGCGTEDEVDFEDRFSLSFRKCILELSKAGALLTEVFVPPAVGLLGSLET